MVIYINSLPQWQLIWKGVISISSVCEKSIIMEYVSSVPQRPALSNYGKIFDKMQMDNTAICESCGSLSAFHDFLLQAESPCAANTISVQTSVSEISYQGYQYKRHTKFSDSTGLIKPWIKRTEQEILLIHWRRNRTTRLLERFSLRCNLNPKDYHAIDQQNFCNFLLCFILLCRESYVARQKICVFTSNIERTVTLHRVE